eukprot:TRINITY_DN20385_c0_g1_i1.p3 TRINITY_DN20385_c0_g1~~TRINITY_DN20385_c0_g1_i1.p3  ORF type:complete len:102 (-),score=12.23 TRINITY_DN20385_c0_g1_i1:53-358(-)
MRRVTSLRHARVMARAMCMSNAAAQALRCAATRPCAVGDAFSISKQAQQRWRCCAPTLPQAQAHPNFTVDSAQYSARCRIDAPYAKCGATAQLAVEPDAAP